MPDDEAPARNRLVEWRDPVPALASGPTLTGIEYITAIAEGRLPGPPMGAVIGMVVREVRPGGVTISATPAEMHYNVVGTVHGGFAATVLDFAMAFAAATVLPEGSAFPSIELKVNFTRPMTKDTGEVTAVGSVVHRGGKIVTAEARLHDGAQRLLAHAVSTCMIVPWGGVP
jgi:uncharacterized protein (TIGR00369 family)